MKKVLAAAALAVALTAGQSYGFALPNDYVGPVSLIINPGYTQTDNGTTWGIFNISSIVTLTNGVAYSQSNIYGYLDNFTDYGGAGTSIYSTGGIFKIFQHTEALTNLTFNSTTPTKTEVFDLITTSDLLLGGVFGYGVKTEDTDVTLIQTLTSAVGDPARYDGKGYADVTEGDFALRFDSDYFEVAENVYRDLDVRFVANTEDFSTYWDYQITGPAYGAAVPEPSTMMLLGLGMFGLAVYGKRRMDGNKA